ncbi:MAG: AMP-binding protein, partial [Oscillospiraceae bacterium]|nr:AMP-binding protein [Oscillospiraceae bacterium]
MEFNDLEKMVVKENITDLTLNDYEADETRLKKILKEKDELGLRNIIVLHVPVCGDFAFAWEEFGSRLNHRRLKAVRGAVFMEDLLKKYKDHEIIPDYRSNDEAAVILHTSGTTKGISKPVPLSDRALNEGVRRHVMSERSTVSSKNRFSSILYLNMSAGFSFAGMFSAFGNGGKLIAQPTIGQGYRNFLAILYYRLTNIVVAPVMFETLISIPFNFDLSSVDSVLMVGSFTSSEAKKRYNEYLERCGCKAKIQTGYGLAEAGVGCTLTEPGSESESVGYLLPGIKAKLWDEDGKCFHDIDGKAHKGVLYLSTPSLSCGRLDDEVLFEFDEIDGEKYLNTHDLFTVAEDGELYYIGRANKFFVNNEGVRFDAGLVERAVSAQKGIGSCGLAPEYDKSLHDTIPVLYVTISGTSRGGRRILKDALEKAYISEGLIEKTALPSKCVITDDIPRTMTGKVDVHRITEGNVRGDKYKTEGIFEAGKLVSIDLTEDDDMPYGMGCDMFACTEEDDSGSRKVPLRLPDEIAKRLESGEITEQKIWKFIKELNSYSDERLEAVALTDCSRDYTYRQLFRMWERYAGAFSALGISAENHSRAAMRGTCAAESISAFFALNMTGASVSMISLDDFNDAESWKQTIKKEGVTDVILTDVSVKPAFVRELAKEKESLGIRNIIILNTAVSAGEQFSYELVREHKRKREEIKKTAGLLFMEDLLKKYGSCPVSFCRDENDDAAVILHTSGTVSGIHKPVPHSDAGMNEAVARIVRDDRFKGLMGRAVTCIGMDMSASYSLIDQVLLMLAFGGRSHVFTVEKPGLRQLMSLADKKANVVFLAGMIFDMVEKLPVRFDFSSFEHVIVGGSFVSEDAKKRFDRFLKRNGAKSASMIGYGVSEAGAACILAPSGREDNAIGYPLSGVRVKLYDESDGRYYGMEDGPRTGVLHIASKSVSCGRIDDKVFFELEDIDGEKYLNTCDLVSVGEDGALYYA